MRKEEEYKPTETRQANISSDNSIKMPDLWWNENKKTWDFFAPKSLT